MVHAFESLVAFLFETYNLPLVLLPQRFELLFEFGHARLVILPAHFYSDNARLHSVQPLVELCLQLPSRLFHCLLRLLSCKLDGRIHSTLQLVYLIVNCIPSAYERTRLLVRSVHSLTSRCQRILQAGNLAWKRGLLGEYRIEIPNRTAQCSQHYQERKPPTQPMRSAALLFLFVPRVPRRM